MCKHLGQAATGTMGRDFKTTMDWKARFGRDPAVSEEAAEVALQSNFARAFGSDDSQMCVLLVCRYTAPGAKVTICQSDHRTVRYAPMHVELAHDC